jgi:hypothetical protein
VQQRQARRHGNELYKSYRTLSTKNRIPPLFLCKSKN